MAFLSKTEGTTRGFPCKSIRSFFDTGDTQQPFYVALVTYLLKTIVPKLHEFGDAPTLYLLFRSATSFGGEQFTIQDILANIFDTLSVRVGCYYKPHVYVDS